jgi:hypothetical protein
MKKTFAISCIILLLAAAGQVSAQADTLAPIRQFLHICNGYKQLPVQLEVDIQSSTNLVIAASDTAHVAGRFALCQNGSYIAMNGLEQLANDSLLLVVNPRTKRMQLYPNRQSVTARLQQYLGGQLQDSSVIQLAAKYQVTAKKRQRDTASIELGSRMCLNHTTLPLQQLQVNYDPATQRPYAVSQLDRSLVPVSDSVFRLAAAKQEWTGRTVTIHDSSFFLVREQTRIFFFRTITHRPETDPPVRISDRITADLTGVYRPVKDYAVFHLTQQVR